jgi:hypothetical protein
MISIGGCKKDEDETLSGAKTLIYTSTEQVCEKKKTQCAQFLNLARFFSQTCQDSVYLSSYCDQTSCSPAGDEIGFHKNDS